MSVRRRPDRIPRANRRPLRRPSNRRLAVVGAIVALVAVAGVVGSRDVGSGSNFARSSSGKADAGVLNKAGDTAAKGDGRARPAPTGAEVATNDAGSSAASTTTVPGASAPEATLAEQEAAPGSGSGGIRQVGAPVDAKIIRTGAVELEVKKGTFAAAMAKLSSTAAGVGGFVSASETSQLGDDPRGTVTLRVPAKDFDRVLAAVGKVGTVVGTTTGSQDVTGEFTDVAAHIKALEAEREQIGLVLAKAENIPDILSVRDRLSAVQAELEQLQGRQQVLEDQTSLSTLTVTVAEKGTKKAAVPTEPEPDRRGLAKLWHDSADRFGDGARAIALGFAAMAPWLLLALVLWIPARVAYRRWATEPASPPAPSTAAD